MLAIGITWHHHFGLLQRRRRCHVKVPPAVLDFRHLCCRMPTPNWNVVRSQQRGLSGSVRCDKCAKVQRHLAQLSSQDQRHGDVRWHCSRHSHQCKRQCVVLEILCRIPPCQETVIRILGSKSGDRPDFVASQAMLTVEQRHTALVHCFTT